ncbi:Aldehyde dehydrogenase, C-terminal [Ostreococcus tauri]|uniref:NADP-dependent glyceraldehyde-3-phosphate dehydrogenase n=1 Tax=Ostreococcus tauri TaxID=70448 RepID=A0A090M869_OSTTA|nr:Aldehyde dehydrogenase, C-terminal [Ostreococcus tauri]CEF98334.1 Aldehyde dehydrogenase, C-terminal [Ostreococcus tauri]|eukprot:XP_003079832.2 Aldehyde dehydrogenase, C-terminal [Ostreococcus tauri]
MTTSSSSDGFYAELTNAEGGALRYAVNGAWRASSSDATVESVNPSRANARANAFQACTRAEVDEAFAGARAAQGPWARTPLHERASLLHRAATLMRENAGGMVSALMIEVAKGAKESATEVERSADLIDYTAEEGVRILGRGDLLMSDSFPGNDRNKICMASNVPVGVVLCIPPFNYPVNLCVSKVAPALIAGNAVVVKPPTQGCTATLHMIHCFIKAGFPPGLIQAVTGRGGEIGDYLTTHPLVNAISFTGGETGIRVAQKAGMVALQTELGGKDACIVLPDADLELAAKSIVKGGFSYSGQRCTAVKIVAVFEEVADELIGKVNERIAKLSVGLPEDDATITAVVSKSSADFIQSLVVDAESKGATLCQEWKREDNLIWPLLIDNVTHDMKICWEEPFGPVLPVVRVKNENEALELVNKSRFGLQGCVFTRDIDRAIRLSDAMQTGTVQINGPPARGPDHFPFQGVKDSGIGSQGITNSIKVMTKVKSTVINLAKPSYTIA